MKRAVLRYGILWWFIVLAVNALGATGDFPVITATESWKDFETLGPSQPDHDPDTEWYLRSKWGDCNDMDQTQDGSWHADGKYSCRFDYKLSPCSVGPSMFTCTDGYSSCFRKVITSRWVSWVGKSSWHGMRFYIKADGLGREIEYLPYDMCKKKYDYKAVFSATGTDPVVVYLPWKAFRPKRWVAPECNEPDQAWEEVWYVASPPMDSGHFWVDAITHYKASTEFAGVTVIPAQALKTPVRINAGSFRSVYTDNNGNAWRPDVGFSQSKSGNQWTLAITDSTLSVAGTASPRVFQSLRIGPAAYYLPIVNGDYTVNLLFSELSTAVTAAGQRVFGVRVNDKEITGIDIFKESGGRGKPLTKTAKVTVRDTMLNIVFTGSGAQPPVISGIEVLSSSDTPTRRPTADQAPGAEPPHGTGGALYTCRGEALNRVPQAFRGLVVRGRRGTEGGSATAVVGVQARGLLRQHVRSPGM